MQTTKQFSDEIINFPAAGFAVASFVIQMNPNHLQQLVRYLHQNRTHQLQVLCQMEF